MKPRYLDDQNEATTERAAIKEFSGNLPRDRAEQEAVRETPCFTCGGGKFWVSIHGAMGCARCHPPAQEKLVTRWVELSDEKTGDEKTGDENHETAKV
jgi:hypothetical protein